jgi:hypothetical protein
LRATVLPEGDHFIRCEEMKRPITLLCSVAVLFAVSTRVTADLLSHEPFAYTGATTSDQGGRVGLGEQLGVQRGGDRF